MFRHGDANSITLLFRFTFLRGVHGFMLDKTEFVPIFMGSET